MPSYKVAQDDACALALRWRVHPELAEMLVTLDTWAGVQFSQRNLVWPGLFVISGYRSPSVQSRTNPDAPNSRHTFCPALAVDLRIGDLPASSTAAELWAWLGRQWAVMGGRWGGLFREYDPNHFDISPDFSLV